MPPLFCLPGFGFMYVSYTRAQSSPQDCAGRRVYSVPTAYFRSDHQPDGLGKRSQATWTAPPIRFYADSPIFPVTLKESGSSKLAASYKVPGQEQLRVRGLGVTKAQVGKSIVFQVVRCQGEEDHHCFPKEACRASISGGRGGIAVGRLKSRSFGNPWGRRFSYLTADLSSY